MEYENPPIMQSPYSAANEPLPSDAATSNGSGTVSTAVIGQAWQTLMTNLGVWIGISVVYMLVMGALYFVQSLLLERDARGLPQQTPFSYFFLFLISIVSLFLGAGLFKVALTQLRTGRAEFGELFGIFDVAAPLFIAAVLTSLLTSVGFALCIVPGVLISLGLSMATPLILDQKAEAIAAMKRSWAVCRAHLGSLFVLGLVLGVINMVGACACGLGFVVTLPLTYLTFAIVYRDLFMGGSFGVAASMPDFPTPPIANP